MSTMPQPLTAFRLPLSSEAVEPPEAHGVARDEVRLAVARPTGIRHGHFRDLPGELQPGDLVVINTSATLPAAVDVTRASGVVQPLHVATAFDDLHWAVELRQPDQSGPAVDVAPGEVMCLPGCLQLTVEDSYPTRGIVGARLWSVTLDQPTELTSYLGAYGRPIRYGYVRQPWPLDALQNVYATEPGSAEMPSAGRPFTDRLLVQLLSRGVAIAPLVLHTGVSSPEKHEPPMPEWFRVPAATARLVNATRAAGHRVVAVGTTVVRALESAVDGHGAVSATQGWTELLLGPERRALVVDGLITGLHVPEASHLLLLEAVAGADLVADAYDQVVGEGYLWHEFGDSMLLLPWRDRQA